MSRIVLQVSSAIASLLNEFIFLPRNHDELLKNFEGFYKIAGFPTVFGTIDCTHVKIIGQGGENGEIYRNRKQFHSINVQSVSDSNLMFQDIVVRWPGSTHDSHIFSSSNLKLKLERGDFENGVLLADGGYKLETYLITPIRNPATEQEKKFNRVQISTRNTVERKYGVWKKRFPCLVFGLRCKIETTMAVIVACAVLHNICRLQNDPDPPNEREIQEAIEATTTVQDLESTRIRNLTNNPNRQAVLKRQSLAAQISVLID